MRVRVLQRLFSILLQHAVKVSCASLELALVEFGVEVLEGFAQLAHDKTPFKFGKVDAYCAYLVRSQSKADLRASPSPA